MSADQGRRRFLRGATLATAGIVVGTAGNSSGDDQSGNAPNDNATSFPRDRPGVGGPIGSGSDRGKLVPGRRSADEPPVAVETPDLPKLPWERKNGAKEFHLVAEHLERELLPDKWYDFWGYNGSMPGPTIEVNEGDRVRVVVHNKLPESTTVHWHGIELPNAMDGVDGLLQDPIKPGQSFIYEFTLHQNGTFFYHSHGPMQESLGMIGLLIVHPRRAHEPAVDRDFGLIVQEFFIRPKATVPDTMSDTFNFFTINGKAGPMITPLIVRLGDRVRIRIMNLSPMDHHPMHLHGHTFWVTGTEGGRIPPSAWIPGNTVLVGVGQSRDVEFIANNPGDWLFHCHILHHMMNHMVPMVGPIPRLVENAADGQEGQEPRKDPGYDVPGYPQDMMDMANMLDDDQIALINTPPTRGMRKDWHRGVMGMMTVLRVLPPDLYDKVTSGETNLPPGASVPGTR